MGSLAAAVLTGLLLASAFAPIGASPAAWIATVPLLLALAARPRRAFATGFAAGMIFRLASMAWVAELLHAHAGASRAASSAAFLLLAAYLSLYTGLFARGVRRAIDGFGPAGLLLAPFLWVPLERANGVLLTGFHWNPLPASQSHAPWIAGVVRTAGEGGVSFLILLASAALAYPLARVAAGPRAPERRGRTAILLAGALLALVPIAALRERPPSRRPAAGERSIRVRLVNPAVPRTAKWTLRFRREALAQLGTLSRAGGAAPDLVIWPEAAVPFAPGGNPPGARAIGRLARTLGAALLFGAPGRARGVPGTTNSAFLVDRGGRPAGRYDKRRRVPFGEYVPLRPLLPFVPALATGLGRGDVVPGARPGVLRLRPGRRGEIPIGLLVCYEAIFPDLAAETVAAGAALIVNLTNDAWLGAAGAAQHFAMARLRAVETGVPLIRVANRGASAVIGPDGAARCLRAGSAAGATDCTLRLAGTPPARPPMQRRFPAACALFSVAALLWPARRRAGGPGRAPRGRPV